MFRLYLKSWDPLLFGEGPWISRSSHCSNKIADKCDLRKSSFWSQFEGSSYHDGGGMVAGA